MTDIPEKWKRPHEAHAFDQMMRNALGDQGLCAFDTFVRALGTYQTYCAYLFLAIVSNETGLERIWRQLNDHIAAEVQSQMESLLERSNFYLCLFVSEEVSEECIQRIESDTYCAKKYVFPNFSGIYPETVHMVESRIFSLPSFHDHNAQSSGITSLTVNNFRVFQNHNFDFTACADNDPAGLVVIYAPNGVGKTSVCDAIEWGLTGKIYRFENIGATQRDRNIRKSAQGLLLHNRKTHKTVEAYKRAHDKSNVTITATIDGEKDAVALTRTVRNAISDYTIGTIMGKIPWGNAEVPWDTVILPHDKLEKFISAVKPEDRFTEWTSCLNSEQEKKLLADYEATNSTVKKLRLEQTNAEKDLNTATKELQRLEQNKTAWDELKSSIQAFNQLCPGESLREDVADSAGYYELRTQAMQLQKKEQNLLVSCQKQCEQLIRYSAQDGEELKRLVENRTLYEQQIEALQKRIRDQEDYQKYVQKREELQAQFRAQNQLLMLSNAVVSYGEEEILRLAESELFFEKNSNLYEAEIQQCKKEWEAYQGRIAWAENERNTIDVEMGALPQTSSELNEIQDEYWNVVSRIQTKNDEITQQNQKLQAQDQLLQEHRNKIRVLQLKLAELPQLEQLEEWSAAHEEEPAEIAQKIFAFIRQYRAQSDDYQRYLNDLSLAEQTNKELENFRRAGKDFLDRHPDTYNCPLCGSAFSNWTSLYAAITNLHQSELEALRERERRHQEEVSRLLYAYSIFRKEWQSAVNDALQAQIQKYEQLRQTRETEGAVRKKLGEDLAFLTAQREHLLQRAEELGFPRNQELKKESVENYLACWLQQLESRRTSAEEEKKRAVAQCERLKEQCGQLKKRLESITEDKQKLIDDPDLNNCIHCIQEAPNKLSELPIDRNELQQKILQTQVELSEISKILQQYVSAEEKTTGQYMQELQQIQKLQANVDCIYRTLSEIVGAEPVTLDRLQEKQEGLEMAILQVETEISALAPILHAVGIQDYLENFAAREAEKNRCESKLEEIKNALEKAKKTQTEQNGLLCNALRERFSQNLFNEIYQKIDPHPQMKHVDYQIDDENEDGKIRLNITVNSNDEEVYQPEWFFSTAQLNTVALSSFLNLALQSDAQPLHTILIDDPVGHFDDLNILGFADLLRSILEVSHKQIIMTTHDKTVFQIIRRKLPSEYYRTRYITL